MQVWHDCSEADIEGLSLGVFSRCKKAKHHSNFVDMSRSVECSSLTQEKVWKKTHVLGLEDLPGHMRHPEILRWVRRVAKHTVRISVCHTSADRPADAVYGVAAGTRASRSGTGCARPVDTTDSLLSDFDTKTTFLVTTAGHVVYDQQEVDNTWVHFFFEDQDDRSGIIVAKAVKMVSVDRERDWCQFVCKVDDEKLGDDIRQQWRENIFDHEEMMRCVTSSFAFTVSHPHSLSQKFSDGVVTLTNKRDFGRYYLKLLTHSCCDLAGIEVKKVLFAYFTDILNKDRDDFWSQDFISFLTNYRQHLTDHLVSQGLIQAATWQEMDLMSKLYKRLNERCKDKVENELRKQTTGQTVSETDKERMRRIITYTIYDSLPCVMWRSSQFIKLKRSVYRAIEGKVRETVGHKLQLTDVTISPRYSVATCAGSSGAAIHGVLVSDDGEKRSFAACHHGGGDKYNVGGAGVFL